MKEIYVNEKFIKEKISFISKFVNEEIKKGNNDLAILQRLVEQQHKEFDDKRMIEEIKKNPMAVKKAFDSLRYEVVLNQNQVYAKD